MNTQHRLHSERRSAGGLPRSVRGNQRHQLAPRNHKFHLIEEHRLARATRAQIQAEVLLLHADIVLPTRDFTALVEAEF